MSGREPTVQLGAVTIRFVQQGLGPYSLLEWTAPPRTQSPPVHVHHRTDEGFYILEGSFGLLLDSDRLDVPAGSHVLVPKGHRHTFWNSASTTSRCLLLLSPPGFEEYFRELAAGLALDTSEEAAMQVRRDLSARYDIEVVGPPVEAG